MASDLIPGDYADWLADLKTRIHQAQRSATLSVNRELISLYWQLGKDILARQADQGWGAKVIERLSRDLCAAFPEMQGFSRANLLYMRAFAEAWPDHAIVQQAVGQLPWGHNIVLLTRLKSPEWRLAYAQQAIQHGWSRNVLGIHIETRRLEREGQAITNFALSRRVCLTGQQQTHRCSRIPTRSIAPRTSANQSAEHRGNRSRIGERHSARKSKQRRQVMSPFEEKMPCLVAELHAQFAESAKLEQAIKANLRGLGYGG